MATTKVELEVQATAKGFSQIDEQIKNLQEAFNKLSNVRIGPSSQGFREIKASFESIGTSFNTLLERVNTFKTLTKNAFSQVFSTKDIEKFRTELFSLQGQLGSLNKSFVEFRNKSTQKTYAETGVGPVLPNRNISQQGTPQVVAAPTFDKARQSSEKYITKLKELKTNIAATTAEINRLSKLPKNIYGDPNELKTLIHYQKEQLRTAQMQYHGMDKGKLSVRNYSLSLGILKRDIIDLITWQARWYGSKMLLFAPLQGMGAAITGFVEWQQAMQNAAAVSNYTRIELEQLKETTLDIGRQTPISAKEASKALLEFAQAGISATAAQSMLPLASKMVVATQEDMQVAVSALTTAFYAWKLEAKDMPAVADQISASMADSKLKVADLATIFNYLGTMAKQAGLSVTDTLTLITVMSKAGVKPSTIGTGLTQAFTALIKMTPKLRAEFTKLKLDWREFQIPQNNPLEVFKKLASSGIDLTAMFKGFETRAGRSVAAIVNQGLQMINETEDKIKEKGFLNKAFETSMDSIQNQAKRFRNIIESDIYGVLDPAGTVFAKFLKYINDGIEGVNGLTDAIRMLVSTISAGLLLSIIKWITGLATIKTAWIAIKALFTGAGLTAMLSNPWVLAAVAIGTVITALYHLRDVWGRVTKDMKEAASEASLGNMSQFALKQRAAQVEGLKNRLIGANRAGEYAGIEVGEYMSAGIPEKVAKRLVSSTTDDALKVITDYQREIDNTMWRMSEVSKGPEEPARKDEDDKQHERFTKYLSDLNKKYSEEIRIIKEGEKQAQDILAASHRLQEISDIDFYARSLENSEDANKKEQDQLFLQLKELNALYKEESAKAKPENLEGIWKDYENKWEEIGRRLLEIDTDNQKKMLDSRTDTILKLRDLENKRLEFEATLAKTIYEREKEVSDFRIEEEKKVRDYLYGKKDYDPQQYYKDEMSYLKARYDSELALAKRNFENWKESNFQKYELARRSPDPNLLIDYNREEELKYQEMVDRKRKASEKFYSDVVEQARKAGDDLRTIFREGGGIFGGSLAVTQKTLGDLSRNTLDMAQNVSDAVTSISSSMESAFMDFFDHTSEGFLNWKNLITSILNDIVKELVRVYIVKQLIGGLQGLFGGSGRGLNTGDIALQNFMPWEGRASGGRVSLNKSYLVGERGPEVFKPNTDGTIIPNGQFGGQPIINIYNNNGSNVSTQTKSDNGKLEIDVMIDQVVAGKLSKFGSSSNKAIRQNFSASQRLTAR